MTQKDFSKDAFEIFDSYHTQLESFAKPYEWCPYLQILPVIGADLNIYPCQDKAYNLEEGLVGSIKNKSFKGNRKEKSVFSFLPFAFNINNMSVIHFCNAVSKVKNT